MAPHFPIRLGCATASAIRRTRGRGRNGGHWGCSCAHPEHVGDDGEVGDGWWATESSAACSDGNGGVEDGARDFPRPSSIPLAEVERTTRQSFLRSSFCSGRAQSAATGGGHGSRAASSWGEENEEEREQVSEGGVGEQVGLVSSQVRAERRGPGAACARGRGHGDGMAPVPQERDDVS